MLNFIAYEFNVQFLSIYTKVVNLIYYLCFTGGVYSALHVSVSSQSSLARQFALDSVWGS